MNGISPYIISVIVSILLAVAITLVALSDRGKYSGNAKVSVADVVIAFYTLAVAFIPFINAPVLFVILAFSLISSDVGDKTLFTFKKRKQSPAQHQSFCPVCKNFH